MKFLILGAGGQLGREWTQYLGSRGDQFSAYRSSEVDITEYDNLGKVIKRDQPEIVVNCAAYTKVDQAEQERERSMKVNGKAVGQLTKICEQGGAKMVHYSTDYIFPGLKEDRSRFPNGYPEDHKASPVNWYGETKWRGEEAVRNSGSDYLIIRTSWLCGQYGSNFITKMIDLSKKHEQLPVVDDQVGSPSFAENVVANSYNLLFKNLGGTYHITTEGIISWYDLAKKLFDELNREVTVKPVSSDRFPTKAARPYFSKLSIERLREVPGSEIWDWKFGLKKLIHKLKK